jgi:peptide/nickel transport system substrate-binding protein
MMCGLGRIALFLLSSVVIASSVAPPPVAGAVKQIVISQPADAVTLDPHMHSQQETLSVLLNVFESLVDFTEKYEPVPALAVSWKQLEPTVWRFVLRKGVTFHNGEAFGAKAVKFSVDRLLDPNQKAPMGTRLQAVKEARIVDDYTVDIVTKEPYAPVLYILSLYLAVVPPDTVKQMGDAKFGLAGIGTGPYKAVKWVKDQELILEANAKHWKGAPRIQRVVWKPIPEDAARVAALQTGEVDLITSVPPDRWKDVQQGKGTRITAKTGTMLYIGLDALNPPFNDIRVRRAMNHAVDVDTIIKKILLNTADRMNGPFFKTSLGYDKNVPFAKYDPALAKKLLAEAGYPNGFETVISTYPSSEGTTNVMEVAETVAYQLQQVGIRSRIDQLERATGFARYKNREFKVYFFTWPENPEPDRHLYSLFHSQARGYYYKNPEADRLLELGRKTFNVDERRKVYQQFHRFIVDDAPWVFLYNQKTGFGVRQHVKWEAPWDSFIRVVEADVSK